MPPEESNPFLQFDQHGRDGYRTVLVAAPQSMLSLHVEVRVGGELFNLMGVDPECATREIREWAEPSPADAGACDRLKLLLDAVCRYFTTGGSWEELTASLEATRDVVVGGFSYPGWHLLKSHVVDGARGQHIFVQDDSPEGNAVVWLESSRGGVPDGLLTFTTLGEIYNEQSEAVWRAAEAGLDGWSAEGQDAEVGGGEPLQLEYDPPEA